jgi:tetratricopeptide (TPR) repeat protein
MKQVLSIILLLSIALSFTAFQCSSTELTSAKLYIQQKNYDKAVESLKQEITKNPQSDEGHYLLGYILGEQGDIEGMLDNYDKSLAISNKFAKNIAESRKYHWADSFNKGVQLFNRGAKAGDTDSANVIFEQAIAKFNGAIAAEPDSADTYKNLAFAYLNIGERDAAIEPYKKVVELTHSEDAYAQLGEMYLQKGVMLKGEGNTEEANKSFNMAISTLEEGKQKYPSSGEILLLLSNAYIGADKLDIAKEAFKEGVEKEPENKYYRYNYGSLLLNAEEYEGAAAQLEKALEIDSDYENAIYNLAVTYVKWGADMREEMEKSETESEEYKTKFEAALPLLEKYLTIKEKESAIWDLLGKVYANLGMAEKSKNAFEKADLYR